MEFTSIILSLPPPSTSTTTRHHKQIVNFKKSGGFPNTPNHRPNHGNLPRRHNPLLLHYFSNGTWSYFALVDAKEFGGRDVWCRAFHAFYLRLHFMPSVEDRTSSKNKESEMSEVEVV
jgi:hypothetical protein